MDRKKILIIDNFEQETVELRKSLITFGYEVRIVQKGTEVEAYFNEFLPDLMVVETRLADTSLAKLIQFIRDKSEKKPIPVIATGNPRTTEERLDVLGREIDDFIYKPFELDEFMVRLENLLREVSVVKERQPVTSKGFSGSLAEMTLVDLLQTLEVGKKTGIISLSAFGREGKVFIIEGDVVDARLKSLDARQALMRMFTWTEGHFSVDMNKHETPKRLLLSTREVISEGMTRQYRYQQLMYGLPAMRTMMKRSTSQQQQVTDDEKEILQLFNGSKAILDIVEVSSFDDLKVLRLIKSLLEKKAIVQADGIHLSRDEHKQPTTSPASNGTGEHHLTTDVFSSVFHPDDSQSLASLNRRRIDRRKGSRRSTDRRSNGYTGEEKVVLNKTELIMIREKLLSGLKSTS